MSATDGLLLLDEYVGGRLGGETQPCYVRASAIQSLKTLTGKHHDRGYEVPMGTIVYTPTFAYSVLQKPAEITKLLEEAGLWRPTS